MRVSASFWSVAPADIPAHMSRLAGAGVRWWHWDYADGTLGPAGGFAAQDAAAYHQAVPSYSEAHLMTANPLPAVEPWCEFCDVVAVHADAPGAQDAVERITALGRRPAVALSPGVGVPAWVRDGVGLLVMSVHPGHGGTGFLPDAVARLRTLAQGPTGGGQAGGPSREIGADGGITAQIGADLARAGATWLVSGTDLVAAPNPAAWLATVTR